MVTSSSTSESEVSPQREAFSSTVPKRALLGVAGLVLLTLGSLAVAWSFPDATLLHFLWVAQGVPVLYLLLAWWGTQSSRSVDDAT